MIKIGDFAKLFDISIKTIRFYEEKGLINPAYVDIYSSYRYFDEKNIDEMSKILFLKNLGFSLDEIKNYNDSTIDNKIKEYQMKIKDLYNQISTLEFLSNKKEGFKMRSFINDEKVIGKWVLSGIYDSKDSLYENKLSDENFSIKTIYFLPNGENYWVISWTKGFLYIKDRECKYEIINDNKLCVHYTINDEEVFLIIYDKIDNNKYTKDDIAIKDDMNVEFIQDSELMGLWQCVDCVKNPSDFNPKNMNPENLDLFVKSLSIFPDFNATTTYKNNNVITTKYTKNYLLEFCSKDTKSKYIIKNIDGYKYLIVEWKSGDYVYSNMINCYYVFKKIN